MAKSSAGNLPGDCYVPRTTTRKRVERAKSADYLTVAENFFKAAEQAREFEYWNAAGLLIVHAAIAFADAICVKLGGVKSRGEDHHEAIGLLDELTAASQEQKQALSQFRRIVDHKTSVSYAGDVYGRKDVELLWRLLVRFRDWAMRVVEK
jgi:hypothetical protein